MQRGLKIESIETVFGQTLREGSWIGWGGRDGNLSTRKVGVVEAITADSTFGYRAKVAWYSESRIYRSQIGNVEQLFVLDPRSIKPELLSRWTNDVGRRY